MKLGQRILSIDASQVKRDVIYEQRYKAIMMLLTMITYGLNGNYANFGVFKLYKDNSLNSALDVSLKLAFSMPLSDVISFPKVANAYFAFFEVLTKNHLAVLSDLKIDPDSGFFVQLITALKEGITSYEKTWKHLCCCAVDHITTFYFNHLPPSADNPNAQSTLQTEIDLQSPHQGQGLCYFLSAVFEF